MDILKLKKELDALCARIDPPFGIVPIWHEPPMTDEQIAKEEARLGVTLPVEIKEAYKVFSSISIEMPYFMGDEFDNMKKAAAQIIGAENIDFLKDTLVVCGIYPLDEWEAPSDKKWSAHHNYRDMLRRAPGLGHKKCQAVYYGCDAEILHDRYFMFIGASDFESIFIDLNPASKHFGAIYNVYPSDEQEFLLVYKIADNYFQFLDRLKKSLEIQLKS